MKVQVASLLLALATACSDAPTAIITSDVVRVTRGDKGLRIENLTDTARAYSVYDPDWLAAEDLYLQATCNTPDATCLRLPAHSFVVVPFTDVGGFGQGTTSVLVCTWRVLPATTPGEYEPVMDPGITLKL